MCIAIWKPQGKKLDKEIYENCFANNSDGAGFAFIHEGKLRTAKGFFTFREFWENFEPLEEKSSIIHFRVGTSGGSNGENCHPWRITENLVFAHNGILPIVRKNQEWSDTGNFGEFILKPMTEECFEWWQQKEFKWMIENAIGSTNKLILMDNNSNYMIFNEKAGTWKDDCWFSNSSFSYTKSGFTQTSCSMSEWEDEDMIHYGRGTRRTAEETEQNIISRMDKENEENSLADIDTERIDRKLDEAESARLKAKQKK